MLYLHQANTGLALKLFRGEPAISEFDWNFSATHSSSTTFSQGLVRSSMKSYLHFNLHMDRSPGFGSYTCNVSALHTRFPYGSVPQVLNLAAYINSPDRSTKSTLSHIEVL